MKFEKMNDQQIRCTLTKEDLAERRIKLSELAYGSAKARLLFRDMMNIASDELGFNTDDCPIMVEAIPMNSECLVLIVTKVDDPEELDTRFAQFAPSLINDIPESEYEDDDFVDPGSSDPYSMSEIFNRSARLKASEQSSPESAKSETTAATIPEDLNLSRLFSFRCLGDIMDLAAVLKGDYNGENSIFKDRKSGLFYLLIHQSHMDLTSFNRVCNIVSEYGDSERNLIAANAFLEEHFETISSPHALQDLICS